MVGEVVKKYPKQGGKKKPDPCTGEGRSLDGLISGLPAGKYEVPTFVCPVCGRSAREKNGRLAKHGLASKALRYQAIEAYSRLAEAKQLPSKGGRKRSAAKGQSGAAGARGGDGSGGRVADATAGGHAEGHGQNFPGMEHDVSDVHGDGDHVLDSPSAGSGEPA